MLDVLGSDAMVRWRLPLLWAFAGGCVSGAVLVGVWRVEAATPPASTRQARASTALVANGAEPRQAPPSNAPPWSAQSANGADHTVGRDGTALVEHDELGGGVVAEPGRSVADVLTRLEAAYREGLHVDAPVDARTAAPSVESVQPAPTAEATADSAERAQDVPAVAGVTVAGVTVAPAPVQAATPEPAPVAVARVGEPAKRGSDAAPEPLADPHAKSESVLALNAAAPPAASVVQNVYVGSVHQGDVVQVQQLAVLQYMQLLALSQVGLAPVSAPLHPKQVRSVSPAAPAARRAPAFPSSITNPDNPWGFDFPPPVLAK